MHAAAPLLKNVDFANAKPKNEDYRNEFVRCDGDAPGKVGIGTFRGFPLSGNYRCSTDNEQSHGAALSSPSFFGHNLESEKLERDC